MAHPKLRGTGDGVRYAAASQRDAMALKVRLLLCAAARQGCTAVVLSAFGCGAFGNPPVEVALLFRKALDASSLPEVRGAALAE